MSTDRPVKTILSAQDFWTAPTADTRQYINNFPVSMREAVRAYAGNMESAHHLYTYPLRLYAAWLGDRVAMSGATAEDIDRLPNLLMDFVEANAENASLSPFKASVYDYALNMYVVLWSLYETFIRDFLKGLFNEFPALLNTVPRKELKDAAGHAELLEAILGGHCHLGDLVTRRSTQMATLIKWLRGTKIVNKANGKLDTALQSRWLHLLAKRRHVVAHRAGVVDEEYTSETGEGVVGEKVPVSPHDIKGCFTGIHNVVFNLLADTTDYITSNHLDLYRRIQDANKK